jgi:hypothetical protein
MTKRAHITSRPEYAVGDRVLGLCGKKFTVAELWDDVPEDKPICRACVDRALEAMTQADDAIEQARLQMIFVQSRISHLDRALNPEVFALDVFAEDDQEYQAKQEEKAKALEEAELPQQNCTCTWTTPEIFTVNPDCPIHGAPVAPPQEGNEA